MKTIEINITADKVDAGEYFRMMKDIWGYRLTEHFIRFLVKHPLPTTNYEELIRIYITYKFNFTNTFIDQYGKEAFMKYV